MRESVLYLCVVVWIGGSVEFGRGKSWIEVPGLVWISRNQNLTTAIGLWQFGINLKRIAPAAINRSGLVRAGSLFALRVRCAEAARESF